MNQNKSLQMIGMAKRAGDVVSGEFMTEKCVKSGKAKLVIIATDASDNTKKMFHNMCEFYKVPIYEYGTKALLGHAIGNEMRASIAIRNEGFAKNIEKHIQASYHNTEVVEWQK
ncbi:MAG: 50S ribosomal protein L7ae [Clostridia bacterium]|nr:50S ribosomal protein L7ae [Clostridia bacterium]